MPVHHFKSLGFSSDEAFSYLWANLRLAVILVNENRQIIAVNPEFSSLLGYSEAELEGKQYDTITAPTDLVYDKTMFSKVLHGELSGYVMVKNYISKYGQIIPLKCNVSCIRSENKKFLFFSQLVDTTKLLDSHPIPVKPILPEMSWKNWLYDHSWKLLVGIIAIISILWTKSVE